MTRILLTHAALANIAETGASCRLPLPAGGRFAGTRPPEGWQ